MAKPVAPQACPECPWRVDSAAGWLGPLTAEGWIDRIRTDDPIECHKTIVEEEWDISPGGPSDNLDYTHQCYGAAVFRTHVRKLPRDKEAATRPADPAILASYDAFMARHAIAETSRSGPKIPWRERLDIIRCEDCEDYWCAFHELHFADCDCEGDFDEDDDE